MINFQRRYSRVSHKRATSKGLKRLCYSIYREVLRFFIHLLVPIYLKSTAKNYRLTPREGESPLLIVSLCSFPARLNTLWIVLELIMRQSVKPDMIVLHLSQKQVPSLDALPQSLIKMQERGLQIKIEGGDDLKPYGKLFYTKRECPNDIIISIDDDIYYPYDTIECLVEMHKKHPHNIIANRARALSFDQSGKLSSYNDWRAVSAGEDTSKMLLLQTGVGGVLYPPNSMHEDFFKQELFQRLAPIGDDLWLYAMTRLKGNRVLRSSFNESLLDLSIKRNSRLMSTNVTHNHNDVQVENIRQYYMERFSIDPFGEDS